MGSCFEECYSDKKFDSKSRTSSLDRDHNNKKDIINISIEDRINSDDDTQINLKKLPILVLSDKYYEEIPAYEDMDSAFFAWLDEHCAEFGFIKRYPSVLKTLTGYDEPWHYRFVGKEVAAFIMENGLCLEQFEAYYR